MTLGIFIFRRDLRLEDNLGLIELSKLVDTILPIFIFDPHQIRKTEHNKHYFSNTAVQFICESVDDLNEQLKEKRSKLYIFYGKPHNILEDLIDEFKKDEIIVGFNKDFSPYAIERDNLIRDVCNKKNIKVIINENDLFITEQNELLKNDNTPFKQYGVFYKHAIKKIVAKPIKNKFKSYYKSHIKNEYKKYHDFYDKNEMIAQKGGRLEVINKLKHLTKFNDYNEKRDLLDYETTNISGALNMGCVSEREVYWYMVRKLGKKTILLKQIYWRDFYLLAYAYLENANSFKKYIDPRFDKIKWKSGHSEWEKLIDCKTGFLLIDAAMSQMKQTGYLHNRGRLLLGCFWTKYLQIDMYHPIYGSQVGFTKYLLDAIGPSQNKMNHHWLLDFDYPGRRFGKGISGRPMKIANDQIKEYDPECKYIKRWLPHLKEVDNKELYKWNGSDLHPKPIFDAVERYKEWITLTKSL
jgi:deoxyribodipyrimidine photo-lyase